MIWGEKKPTLTLQFNWSLVESNAECRGVLTALQGVLVND